MRLIGVGCCWPWIGTGEPHARMRVARAGEARGRCRAKVFAGFSWFSVLCFLPQKVLARRSLSAGWTALLLIGGVVS